MYGLAGFFAASAILVAVADFLNVKNIPGFYFWLLPFGFVVGLVFPRYVGHVFMNVVSRGQENPEKELNLDKAVKGPAVVVVKIVAFAALVL